MLPAIGLLTPHQEHQLVDLLLDFTDVFMGPDGKVGYNNRVLHRIETGDAEPRKSCWFRKSFKEMDHIESEITDLLKEDRIEPSSSPWASSVVLVRKKDGKPSVRRTANCDSASTTGS